MREAVRGYAVAVLEAVERDRLERLAGELGSVRRLLAGSPPLREVVSDGAIAAGARLGVLEELLAGRVLEATLKVIGFVLRAEPAPEVPPSLESLAERAAAELTRAEGEPPLDPPVGRTALKDRVEGYAIALFEGVEQRSQLDDIEDGLFRFARIVESVPSLAATLGDQNVPEPVREDVVGDLLEGRTQPLVGQLCRYVVRNARGRELVAVLDWLVEVTAAERGRRLADVRLAVEPPPDLVERLENALSALSGRRVEMRVQQEPALMGGVVAVVGDVMIDTSVRHRLELVRAALSEVPLKGGLSDWVASGNGRTAPDGPGGAADGGGQPGTVEAGTRQADEADGGSNGQEESSGNG
ncbi:MAG: F0F1 ATP synthase subunit delta [Actinomycetota bacterium]|nr:F0F1 ATP synthase subunit delta [Actinomycetota bacterium]